MIGDTIHHRLYNNDGELHREDGPAVINAVYTCWYINGKRHRFDGPAYVGASGVQYWFINGKRYHDNKSFQKAANITDEDMSVMILKYSNIS
jgi:hypothetical protein